MRLENLVALRRVNTYPPECSRFRAASCGVLDPLGNKIIHSEAVSSLSPFSLRLSPFPVPSPFSRIPQVWHFIVPLQLAARGRPGWVHENHSNLIQVQRKDDIFIRGRPDKSATRDKAQFLSCLGKSPVKTTSDFLCSGNVLCYSPHPDT